MTDLLEMARKQRAGVIESKEEPAPKEIIEPKPKKKATQKKEEEFKMEIIPKGEKKPKTEPKHELANVSPNDVSMFSKEDITRHLEMYNYVKKSVVDKNDFYTIKGKEAIKKSGVRKFINAFCLSIEFIEKNVYNLKVNGQEDTHAEVRVRAITPKGQSVEGIGIKSMSELFEKTLHNLISTAWTRAVNRAVLDLVAFGEVSAEEIDSEPESMF